MLLNNDDMKLSLLETRPHFFKPFQYDNSFNILSKELYVGIFYLNIFIGCDLGIKSKEDYFCRNCLLNVRINSGFEQVGI